MIVIFIYFLCFVSSQAYIQLQCSNNSQQYSLSNGRIKVEVKKLNSFALFPSVPCVFDFVGKCHQTSYLSTASVSTYFCSFSMSSFIISEEGAIFQSKVQNGELIVNEQVTFDHPTISGPLQNDYYPEITATWHGSILRKGSRYKKLTIPMRSYDLVIPLRMQWDDCFNHLSFEFLPLIGAVYVLYQSIWNQAVFHCSMFTGAILNALGIPMDRLIFARTIHAKKIQLPWIPHWLPISRASMSDISASVCSVMTQNLINKKFHPNILKMIGPLNVVCISHPDAEYEVLMSEADLYRYIVYNTRQGQDTRDVYKEKEILEMINSVIDKSKYRLIVVGHSHGYKNLEYLQASWQRYAKVYSKAIVMMGPHGSASNNMMFTPSDCHAIEFNHFPEEKYSAGTTVVRPVALLAHFAKGGTGKFYNIEPNNSTNKIKPDMYFEGWMKVSQRDVLLTLMQINKDIPNHDLLIEGIDAMKVPALSETDLKVPTKKTPAEIESGKKSLNKSNK